MSYIVGTKETKKKYEFEELEEAEKKAEELSKKGKIAVLYAPTAEYHPAMPQRKDLR